MKSNIKSSFFATWLVLLFSLTTMASTPRQGNLNEENVIAQMTLLYHDFNKYCS